MIIRVVKYSFDYTDLNPFELVLRSRCGKVVMERNLLILGAGIYSLVAYEIAVDMGCFGRIDFADDGREYAYNGSKVVGGTEDLGVYSADYTDIAVAIGNPAVRLSLISKIKSDTECNVATLVSPKAYIAPSALIGCGCVIEPMAVVHSGCVLSDGCIVSAGAVVNHAAKCLLGVHVDCNATVPGNVIVPEGTKVKSGTVFDDRI